MSPGTINLLCVICGIPISAANDSKEHVIPESIGGRIKVQGFICRACNNEAGRTWDAELADQLHPLSLLFQVARQRGSTPDLQATTTAGEQLTLRADKPTTISKPIFEQTSSSEGERIAISARSLLEARRMALGVKRKYPGVDVEQAISNAQVSQTYPKGWVHFRISFGGESAGRSMVKSLLAMAHRSGVSASRCNDAIAYVRSTSESPCFGYFLARDLVFNRPVGVPLHCVAIEANPDSGLILGYAEYFGVYRAVACLGHGYVGSPIKSVYGLDPCTGQELALSVALPFHESDLKPIYDYEMIPDGALQEAYAAVLEPALKSQQEAEKLRVINDAAEFAFANCGAQPGETLSAEHIATISRLMSERLTPYVLHVMAPADPGIGTDITSSVPTQSADHSDSK